MDSSAPLAGSLVPGTFEIILVRTISGLVQQSGNPYSQPTDSVLKSNISVYSSKVSCIGFEINIYIYILTGTGAGIGGDPELTHNLKLSGRILQPLQPHVFLLKSSRSVIVMPLAAAMP